MSTFEHVSVLANEVVAHLPERQGFVFADLTLGGGGHAHAIFEARPDLHKYIGVDRDPVAIAAATARLSAHASKLQIINSTYSAALSQLPKVDGLLADLGVSSPQLDDAARGFSFMRAGPLDMRMGAGQTLAEYLASVEEEELARVIYTYGEERFSRRVARAILAARDSLKTTLDLANVVRGAMPKTEHRIDPATRTFQALRIAVNDELGELEALLAALPDLLNDGGVAAVISFHSLEDRAVKHALRGAEALEVLTRKPLEASEDEARANPRARSAKLRVARRRPRGEEGLS
jgi:16S rRNA (cytosine1402-N4)-methyltransferase